MACANLYESPEEEDNHSPGPDDWHRCPRKRTQTLPAFSCPLTGMATKADVLNRWSRIQESVEEKSGTLTEDIFKILDLRISGPLFGGSQISNKEGDVRLKALPHQQSVGDLAESGSVQQLNCRSEQKTDSQQLVDSLQEENKKLRARMAELQSALEADRRHVAALEICLRNAERSRDEAKRCNEELQREIQQFLTRQPQPPT